MNEEIDEFDFYHQDFTTASEWEIFIARIEEILNDFNVSKVKSPLIQECENSEKCSAELSFYGSSLTLSYYNVNGSDAVNADATENNLSKSKPIGNQVLNCIWEEGFKFVDDTDKSRENSISSWYGLKRYLMLRPATPLCDENQIKLIMSSVNIALANSECRIPFFVKIREDWQQCYQGIFEDSDFRTQFDTIHLKRIPSQCYHLSGLLNLFKGKISSPQPLEPVEMAAKFSYNMKDLEIFSWRRPRHNDVFANGFELSQWMGLPIGAAKNCIKHLYLHVMWPKFFEDAVIDSPSYSDFDPLMAPVWTVSCETEDNFQCILQELLAKFFDMFNNNDLVMDSIGMSKNLGILNPLNRITETPSISKLVKSALSSSSSNQTSQDFKGPLSDDYLMPLLYYIFPDAVEDHSSPYPEHLEVDRKEDDNCTLKVCSYIKSGPVDGLVWRLSIILARLFDIGGLSWLAHFWYEFTQELQYRWDNKILIPGVCDGTPNARTCLLHQKMQLLNCCVQRAQAAAARDDERGSSSGEDEFYDCAEDVEEGVPPAPPAPAGRLCRLGDATTSAGEPLYVPVTQEPAPKTEEQLEEDAELMLRLGDGARASELRARMMSASLLSDMESFKAANPGAELADFVRWYSPRDFDAAAPGRLSERMLLPGNPWEEAWRTARPLPAARQRRLFDERREAERALHYLRARTAADVAELTLPSLLRAGARALAAAGAGGAGPPPGCEPRRLYELAAAELAEAEAAWARRARLSAALGEAVPGAPLDAAARTRLTSAAGAPPARREFVLRVRDARAPHLMRALLAGDLQLIAAFTEPTIFMN